MTPHLTNEFNQWIINTREDAVDWYWQFVAQTKEEKIAKKLMLAFDNALDELRKSIDEKDEKPR